MYISINSLNMLKIEINFIEITCTNCQIVFSAKTQVVYPLKVPLSFSLTISSVLVTVTSIYFL